ncbi:MAG: uncharacterized protein JWN15_565 [Firmicutes bacterium]|nr:uncharacterized protein [Bacillota bacterium]
MRPLLAGFTVRALAESTVRAGALPVAVDYFGDRDLKAVCPEARSVARAGRAYDPRWLIDLAQELTWDAVLYTGGLENHPGVVAEFARRAPLFGNSPAVLRSVRDWRQVSAGLAEAGFRVPMTLPPGATVPERGSWLVKPVAGSGGAGVAAAVAGDRPRPGKLIQERLPGAPGSALFVADGQRACLLGVTELLTPMPAFGGSAFQYAGNILLPDSAPALRARLEALCQALTARFGLAGVGGVDFIMADGEPVPLEVNPRYTAAMELLEDATGCNLFALHLDGCHGRWPAPLPPTLLPPWRGCYGKAIVYGDQPGTWRFDGDWAAEGIRDVPFPGDAVLAGRPVCTVVASGDTRDACLARLEARARAVREAYVDGGNH